MSGWCGLGNMAIFFLGSPVTSATCARYSTVYNRKKWFLYPRTYDILSVCILPSFYIVRTGVTELTRDNKAALNALLNEFNEFMRRNDSAGS